MTAPRAVVYHDAEDIPLAAVHRAEAAAGGPVTHLRHQDAGWPDDGPPCEVIASEPNRRFAFRSTGGPFPLEFTYTCEPSGAGTRFTHAGEGEPGAFFRLVGPVFENAAKRQVRNDLETLKDLLESKV